MRFLFCLAVAIPLLGQTYDLVIANGRVLDPATNLDAVRNIGVRGGKIAAISAAPLRRAHTHRRQGPDGGARIHRPAFARADAGELPLQGARRRDHGARDGGRGLAGGGVVRRAGREGADQFRRDLGPPAGAHGGDARYRHAAAARQGGGRGRRRKRSGGRSATLVRRGLDEGALGIGMGIAYDAAGDAREEVLGIFRLAAERKAAIYVHMRNSGPMEPGAIDALQEVIADAAASGASLHVVHITSTGLRETPLCLEMIAGARARHLDVTTEAYPYTAGMTDISSAIFSEGWQARQGGIAFWRPAMGGHRRAADGGNVRALPQAGRHGGDPLHSGGGGARGHGESAGDDRERRHHGERQRASARRGNVCAGAGALRARAARAQPDGRHAQDDA